MGIEDWIKDNITAVIEDGGTLDPGEVTQAIRDLAEDFRAMEAVRDAMAVRAEDAEMKAAGYRAALGEARDAVGQVAARAEAFERRQLELKVEIADGKKREADLKAKLGDVKKERTDKNREIKRLKGDLEDLRKARADGSGEEESTEASETGEGAGHNGGAFPGARHQAP